MKSCPKNIWNGIHTYGNLISIIQKRAGCHECIINNFVYAELIDLIKFGIKNFVNLWLCMFEIICDIYRYQLAFSKIRLNVKWLFIVLISPIGYLPCLKLDAVWLLTLFIDRCWLVAYIAYSWMLIGCIPCLKLNDDWLFTLPTAWWWLVAYFAYSLMTLPKA